MFHFWRAFRAFNRDIRIFLIVCAIDAFGYFGIQVVLFNLYLLRLGFGTEFIGMLIASGQIVWAIAALPAGAVSQRFGLRPALISGFLLSAVGMGLVLLVELLPRPVWSIWLFGSWAVLWIGAALYSVNTPPYLMEVSTAETRSHAFAAQGVVLALMGFAGSFLAGSLPGLFVSWAGASLDQPTPYRYALWAAPLSYLVCALLWTRSRPVKVSKSVEVASSPAKPIGLFVFFVLLVFLQTASEGIMSFFNVYLDTGLALPAVHIGTILGLGQLLSIIGVLAVPRLLLRTGAPTILTWSTMGIGIAMLPLALFPSWLPATIGFISVISMTALNGTVRSIFSQEIVLPQWRSTTSALLTIGLAFGWASAAAVGGYLIAQAGFTVLFLIGAGLALSAVLLLWSYRRKEKASSNVMEKRDADTVDIQAR